MHFMLTWGREEAPLELELTKKLEKHLEGHAWVRAFPGAYVMASVYGEAERQDVVDALVAAAQELEIGDFALLVSPLIKPSSTSLYEGWLNVPQWDKINQFTSSGRRVES